MLSRPHDNYSDDDIRDVIVPAYFDQCAPVDIDAVLTIAQMIHETGNLTSFWSARGDEEEENKRRNSAGIGVTGAKRVVQPVNTANWAYNPQSKRWEAGCGFASWKDHSVPAHIGRLAAYAIPIGQETPQQQALINQALAVRPLPKACRGSAPTLKQLGRAHNPQSDKGCGWAGKDTGEGVAYGSKIAAIANAITRMPL
jgi:hypothetical protein